jgi:hypothetical protein
MHLKLTSERLIGDVVRPAGYVFVAEGKYAEAFVRAKAAVPVPPPSEAAQASPRGQRATRR